MGEVAIETRRLEYFLTTLELGSISRAARKLGVAQPALSQQLMVLEREVGAKLLDRSAAGVTPTAAGAVLHARAQVIVRHVDALRGDVGVSATSGPLTLGILPTEALILGGRLLDLARQRLKSSRLTIVEQGNSGLLDRLANGAIDFAFVANRPMASEIVGEALATDRLVVLGSKSRVRREPLTIDELASEDWIMPTSPNAVRVALSGAFAEAGFDPRIAAEVNSLPAVIDGVARGLGLSLVPLSVANSCIAAGRTQIVETRLPAKSRTIHLCYLGSKHADEMVSMVRSLFLDALHAAELDFDDD